jgi:crossover junction endodeoxyribonuclease RuvC
MRVRGGKDGSRERAAAIYPVKAQLFARKKDDGRSDAALIATHGAQSLAAL